MPTSPKISGNNWLALIGTALGWAGNDVKLEHWIGNVLALWPSPGIQISMSYQKHAITTNEKYANERSNKNEEPESRLRAPRSPSSDSLKVFETKYYRPKSSLQPYVPEHVIRWNKCIAIGLSAILSQFGIGWSERFWELLVLALTHLAEANNNLENQHFRETTCFLLPCSTWYLQVSSELRTSSTKYAHLFAWHYLMEAVKVCFEAEGLLSCFPVLWNCCLLHNVTQFVINRKETHLLDKQPPSQMTWIPDPSSLWSSSPAVTQSCLGETQQLVISKTFKLQKN